VLLQRLQQDRRLDPVPGAVRRQLHEPTVQSFLHAGHDELHADLGDPAIAELQDLGEVVPGVDVHHRERDPGRVERLLREPEHHDRVLAAGEQQHRTLELGGHLAEDVDRFGLQRLQLGQLVVPAHEALTSASAG
jgi:hypothetical protein